MGYPYALKYNGTTYYYITNLQGDVMGMVNSSGTSVASYTYDPYGKVLTATGSMAAVNPLRYRGYYYDIETGFYYLQSRYYDPAIGRFINADSYASTGQGFIGCNMFAYCLNNPINYVDINGKDATALQWWTGSMWWLCGADAMLPIGDLIYGGGIIVFGLFALATMSESSVPEIIIEVGDNIAPPSPNNNDDDDDDDDDYYDDDSNFGGRQKMGKSNRNTPGNNQAQNKQFRDATKGLSKEARQQVHREISHEGGGYHDIVDVVKNLFIFITGFFVCKDFQ